MDTSLLVGPAVKELYGLVRDRLSKRLDRSAPNWSPVFDRLEDYLGEVLRWSSRIQFFGMPEAEDTDSATVELRLGFEPRRFRGSSSPGGTMSEPNLLSNPYHYVILGDPGSGKTTTLKRLARAVMLNEAHSSHDIYRYPIVIRLREHLSANDFDRMLADVIGIRYEVHETKGGPRVEVADGSRLSDVIPQFLDATNAILMLDGMDELPEASRRILEQWVVALSYRLAASKIIITSRSGDYYRYLDGFNVVELCPLAPEQARQIAEKWLTNADEFLSTLSGLPYHDLADRPLLLSQLIVLFRREGALPEQPAHVYRRLLRLLLEDWDNERGISRSSRYAGFDPDRKADFLAALSYHLTYRLRRSSFTHQDLVDAYERIHRLFGLPQKEASEVAEEIASHSGLINTSGSGYEFSHLSFQEYLCAAHLVREPFPELLEKYVADRPAPLAIAVAISSNPGDWFAGLFLKETALRAFTPASLTSFLSRLRIERPLFGVSRELGFAVMRLFHDSAGDAALRKTMLFLFDDAGVLESISHALLFYVVPRSEQPRPGEYLLHVSSKATGRFEYEMPERVAIPQDALARVLKLRWVSVPVTGGGTWHTVRLNEAGETYF